MRYLLSSIYFFLILSAFSQDLILNFEQLSDSVKNEEVMRLIQENRSTPLFEDRVTRLKEIARFCQQKNDLPTEGLAVTYLCISYLELGKFDEADEISAIIDLNYFEHILPQHQLRLNLYRAQPLVSQGRLDEGIELAQNTLAICEEHNLPKNNIYGLLSTIYTGLGKFNEALEMDRDNLSDILHNHPETVSALGQVYYSLSRDFTNLNQLDSANYYGIKSIGYWENPVSQLQLGDIKTRLTEFDSARYYFTQGEEIIESSLKWEHQRTTLYIYLAQLEIRLENWKEGLYYSEKALAIAQQENDHQVSQKARENIIRAYLQNKGYYFDDYLFQHTVVRNEGIAAQTIEMDTKYKTVEKEKEILTLSNNVQQQEIETLRFRNYLLYAGISVIILFILFYLLYRIRKNKNEKELSRLTKQALQLQMNPHFFFNSLNSIHNFIGNNNTEQAQKYLVNFSKLMRLTLENSQENLIPLKKEVEFLNNFLILEKLRNKNFDFEIEVADELMKYKIPSFLIQPLIENSILHGFLKINYEGIVQLKIVKEQDYMLVSVIDNGVGRAKSIQEKGSNKNEQSFGIEVLKKRIAVYSKKANIILMEDGIAESGNLGTKISFQLPIFD